MGESAMNDDQLGNTAAQVAAFQKMWLESFSKILQATGTATPNSPPPEIVRQIRSGILQALAQSWEEFMRSPQFLEGMKQWMENAVSFRRLTSDFMAGVRSGLHAPSRGDIDTIMLTVRHMEKRLLDRLEELGAKVGSLEARLGQGARTRGPAGSRSRPARGRPRRPSTGTSTPRRKATVA
jgi:hypothetical protein